MNIDEAFELYYAKHGGHDLPWEVSREAQFTIFYAGWSAHAESLKQADLFPGTWSKDGMAAAPDLSSQRLELDTKAYFRDLKLVHNPAITAEDIYAAWPVKKARGAAIKAIQKAMKKEKPELLLAAVKELAGCYAKWPVAERQYLPMCSTFMNQERWSDDRATWRKGADATTSQFSKTY